MRQYTKDNAAEIGTEKTPAEYIASLVQVFREVWRALKDDGLLFLNLGDSYSDGAGGRGDTESEIRRADGTSGRPSQKHDEQRLKRDSDGFKPKSLMMIPARVAIALCDDGWYLRSEITWCKKCPMPESVTDRPTSATEKIYMLSKSPKYFYEQDAVREPLSSSKGGRNYHIKNGTAAYNPMAKVNAVRYGDETLQTAPDNPVGRNMWNYWLLAPESCSDVHFATFPSEIPRRCIKAGSKTGDVVLDPFAGSFTTGAVALDLGRRFIGIELSPEYMPIGIRRMGIPRLPFTSDGALPDLQPASPQSLDGALLNVRPELAAS